MDTSELYHYGIPGMKWGIRKYVNYDGSLTAEGKKKYGTYDNFYKAYTQNKRGVTSTQQLIKEKQYQNKGMSEKEAQVKAIGKRQTEKVLAITAGVSMAAIGTAIIARGAYGYTHDQEYDSMANVGDKKNSINGVIYARGRNKKYDSDAPLYKYGLLGEKTVKQIMGMNVNSDNQYDNNFTSGDGSKIKIASSKNAAKIFNDLYKNNDEFKRSVMKAETGGNDLQDIMTKMTLPVRYALTNKNGRAEYNKFNRSLPAMLEDETNTADTKKALEIFGDALKKKGYSGFNDANDTFGAGMPSRTASILVDDTLKSAGSVKLSSSNKYIGLGGMVVAALAPTIGMGLVTKSSAYNDIIYPKYNKAALLRQAGYSHDKISKSLKISKEDAKKYTKGVDNTLTKRATMLRKAGQSYAEIAKALGIPKEQVGGYLKNSK